MYVPHGPLFATKQQQKQQREKLCSKGLDGGMVSEPLNCIFHHTSNPLPTYTGQAEHSLRRQVDEALLEIL